MLIVEQHWFENGQTLFKKTMFVFNEFMNFPIAQLRLSNLQYEYNNVMCTQSNNIIMIYEEFVFVFYANKFEKPVLRVSYE